MHTDRTYIFWLIIFDAHRRLVYEQLKKYLLFFYSYDSFIKILI